ncbi:MAG: hypothetical protein P8L37_02275 [Phycisphaerales bacterium]|nr:hypothetical protein [Phycisphaerales bacterium]
MGQLALGVRSLLIRLVIFFIMAILLAWALGGTLWPRPVTANAITGTTGDISWSWNARVSSYDASTPLTYSLQWTREQDTRTHWADWTAVVGFVFDGDVGWTAAYLKQTERWSIVSLRSDGSIEIGENVADRFAANAVLLSKRP